MSVRVEEANGRRDEASEVERLVRLGHPRRTAELLEREPVWGRDFADLTYEGRRLFGELFGTFLLVLAGAGGKVLDVRTGGAVGRAAAVTAPGLTVLAVILFMGAVSGAHLNPVVSVAFALRRDFQWRRVPSYVVAQLAGATVASLVLRATFGEAGKVGATVAGPGFAASQVAVVEGLLTLGLVSVILGTASTAQNVGPLSAVGVGAYIVLAGLWAGPVSGAAMNPARSLGPDIARGAFAGLWPYLVGPSVGMAVAVAAAFVLRGPGGGPVASKAAQGSLSQPVSAHTPDAGRGVA